MELNEKKDDGLMAFAVGTSMKDAQKKVESQLNYESHDDENNLD